MMRLHLSMLALLGLLLSAPAAADLTIHYAPEPPSDRPLIIEADGQGRMRADLGAGQLIMMRDGDIFVVTVGEDHPNVVRLDDFLAVAAESAHAFRESHPIHGALPQSHYRLSERGPGAVGAWHGTRLAIEQIGPHDSALDVEWVVSSDPALAEAGRTVTRLIDVEYRIDATIVDFPPETPAIMRQLADRGAPLRMTMTQSYRLESVSADPVAASRFDLPGPVLSREQFRARQH